MNKTLKRPDKKDLKRNHSPDPGEVIVRGRGALAFMFPPAPNKREEGEGVGPGAMTKIEAVSMNKRTKNTAFLCNKRARRRLKPNVTSKKEMKAEERSPP